MEKTTTTLYDNYRQNYQIDKETTYLILIFVSILQKLSTNCISASTTYQSQHSHQYSLTDFQQYINIIKVLTIIILVS